MSSLDAILASGTVPIHWGGFQWHGGYTAINLIAAATNALNGALLARRPDHYKGYTAIGIVLMAIVGGIGGGVARDVLVGQVPEALTNPAYILLCLGFGIIGYLVAYKDGQLFREGLFQFMTSFALPWYAIVGAQKGASVGLPVVGCLLLAVVGPTAGRYFIDITSGVTPKQFIRGEWFVTTAGLTGLVWILADEAGAGAYLASAIAFVVGFVVRVLALFFGWEEPLAKEPEGVVVHGRRRPLLGRKLVGMSNRQMEDLGLTVPDEPSTPSSSGS
jgi:uncharacterized membrane protein YeiH